MDYCGPAAIPLGFFLGGPDEWDPFSRDAALAWALDKTLRCPDCGQYEDDWRDAEGVELRPNQQPLKPVAHRCPPCAALEGAVNREDVGEKPLGRKWRWVPSASARRSASGGR